MLKGAYIGFGEVLLFLFGHLIGFCGVVELVALTSKLPRALGLCCTVEDSGASLYVMQVRGWGLKGYEFRVMELMVSISNRHSTARTGLNVLQGREQDQLNIIQSNGAKHCAFGLPLLERV